MIINQNIGSFSHVGIVVLNFKGAERTLACLESLRRVVPAECLVEVVVVDNASRDGSVGHIQDRWPDIHVIENKKNVGYAGGNNRGAEYLIGKGVDAIWILNNDTLVHPASLSRMIQLLRERPKVGVVGCVTTVMSRGGVAALIIGGRLSWIFGTSRLLSTRDGVQGIDFVSGASMLIRRDAWEEVGGLSEDFFLYWEDADFSLRIKQQGWELGTALDAEVQHDESATLGRGSMRQLYYMNREYIRFALLHSPAPAWTLIIGYSLRIVKRLVSGRWWEVWVVLRGMMDGWRGRNAPYRETTIQF